MSQMSIGQAHLVLVKVQGELWASGHVDEFRSEPPRTLPNTPIAVSHQNPHWTGLSVEEGSLLI